MITIILPISRKDYLKPVFDCLDALIRPPETELVIITDGDIDLQMAVDRKLDSINYFTVMVVNFGETPAEDIDSRRYRISAIHNRARRYVAHDTQYVLSIEDDTVYPPDILLKMLDTFERYEDCKFVEGVELGRHKTKCVGAWRVDDMIEPRIIKSAMPAEGVERIDAGGLYCGLIDAEIYRNHEFEPYDKQGKIGLSCDFNLGYHIRKLGFGCYIDWTIHCDHIGDKGSVNLGNTKPVQVEFSKNYKGKWEARTLRA